MSSVTGHAHGIGAAHASARSSPVYTATTPGMRRRGRGVDAGDPGVGVRATHDGEVQRAGDVEVVGEPGLTGQEGGILAAQQALADDPGRRRRRLGGRHAAAAQALAAARTAWTMLW